MLDPSNTEVSLYFNHNGKQSTTYKSKCGALVTILSTLLILVYVKGLLTDMNAGKNDEVTQTKVVNMFQGHHQKLDAGEMGFMPFLLFDIKNTRVGKF